MKARLLLRNPFLATNCDFAGAWVNKVRSGRLLIRRYGLLGRETVSLYGVFNIDCSVIRVNG